MGQLVLGFLIGIIGILISTFGGLMTNDAWNNLHNAMGGIISPDNKPIPNTPTSKNIPADAFALFFGNSVSYTKTFPHTVIEVDKKPILIINKEKGNITISAKFFSDNGKIVAELKENKFFVNPNNYFRLERPNKHILIVYDQQANQILNIHFLNPSMIKLLGTFYLPNRPPILIEEELQSFGNLKISGSCLGNNRVDIALN